MRALKTKLFALIFAVGMCLTAVAAADELVVQDAWLTGETLNVAVIDGDGETQTLKINLMDYTNSGDEYVTVRATDSSGRTSNAVQFKNPFYAPPEDEKSTEESAVSTAKPLTPDGSGTVLDDVTNGDGKEFFTVETPDGNVFYLIVDRQRNGENVYFLNAVTEDDLASLAKSGNGKVSAISTPEPTTTAAPTTTTASPEVTPEPAKTADNTGIIAVCGLAVLAVGGAAYYFKVVRPKKANLDEPEDFADDPDLDENEDEDGDDE